MAIEICPMTAEWGNLADWVAVVVAAWGALASVVVGAGAAAATVWVALLAHRTSKRATQIAVRATEIAQQQHDEAVNLRLANARIVGRIVFHEVASLPLRIHAIYLLSANAMSTGTGFTPAVVDAGALQTTLQRSRSSLLPASEKSEDRIHTLPNKLGDDLATLIGFSRTLKETSGALLERIEKVPSVHDARIINAVFRGDVTEIYTYREFLVTFSIMSIGFANELRGFIGVPVYDYSKYAIGEGEGE